MINLIKKYYIIAIALLAVVVIIILSLDSDDTSLVFQPIANNEVVEVTKFIYVDIKGEVMNPGVYKVEDPTRLFQVISLAGGTTMNADLLAFNMSMKLRDEQVIYIPSVYDDYPLITDIVEDIENGIVNINTASLEQLDTLPGIGPTTAQSIIDYREENGDFSNIDDILFVIGIGESTLNEIREFITV